MSQPDTDSTPAILKPDSHTYLGDGVYASFDGYQIWLAANDHRNKVVALEPSVFDQLNRYAKNLTEAMSAFTQTGPKAR